MKNLVYSPNLISFQHRYGFGPDRIYHGHSDYHTMGENWGIVLNLTYPSDVFHPKEVIPELNLGIIEDRSHYPASFVIICDIKSRSEYLLSILKTFASDTITQGINESDRAILRFPYLQKIGQASFAPFEHVQDPQPHEVGVAELKNNC